MLGELEAAERAQAGSRLWGLESGLLPRPPSPKGRNLIFQAAPRREACLGAGVPAPVFGSGKHSQASVSPSPRSGGGTPGPPQDVATEGTV